MGQRDEDRRDDNRRDQEHRDVIHPKERQRDLKENLRPQPRYGTTINAIPRDANRIHHGDVDYFYHDGIYYRSFNKTYVVAHAPIGIRIGLLPKGFRPIMLNHNNYFYYYGTFYVRNNDYYEVVAPPIGAVVETIPNGYEKIDLNGESFFIADGIQYKAVIINNEIWYQVTKVMR
jgi:hypothetical protein